MGHVNKKSMDKGRGDSLSGEVGMEGLPLLGIFSRDIKLNETLMEKIDSILEQRMENEMVISKWLNEGIRDAEKEVSESDVKLVELHNKGKDSISDLVRIRQLLNGSPTKVVLTIEEKRLRIEKITKMVEEVLLVGGSGAVGEGEGVGGASGRQASDGGVGSVSGGKKKEKGLKGRER